MTIDNLTWLFPILFLVFMVVMVGMIGGIERDRRRRDRERYRAERSGDRDV